MSTSSHTENTEVISRDGMFAAALNGFISYATGTDKELWRDLTATRLKIIMPDDLATNQGQHTALFIFLVANVTKNVEIESEILNLLRPYKGLYDEVIKIDYSGFDLSNEMVKQSIIEMLAKSALESGVKSLKAGFDEIDAIAIEYGVKNHTEEQISEMVGGAE